MQFQISLLLGVLVLIVPIAALTVLIIALIKQVNRKNNATEPILSQNELKLEQLKMEHSEMIERKKLVSPLKIQAMERLILYLERIQPQSLVKRNLQQGSSIRNFHLALLQNIREEFEHNLAQQLYVSEKTWQLISTAKEELIKQINLAVSNLPENATAEQLASILLTLDISVSQMAIQAVKLEFTKL
ncbi:MAG: hypothetical protein PF694_09605 [Bacteroidetes bacterium]|jgi:hypothetical protein|nr:hypothetical protein [Bacteroidota bacterium]